MFEPGLPTSLIGVGFVLANIGFWTMYVALWKRKALGSSRSSFGRLRAVFRSPKPGRERLIFRIGPAVVVLGAIFCFTGVGLSDARRGAPCVASCEAAGHKSGRLRNNPHTKTAKKRQCWCYNGTHSRPLWVHQRPTGLQTTD